MSAPTNEIIGVNAAYERSAKVTNQLLKEAADRVANLKKAIEDQEAANKLQEAQHLQESEPLLAKVKELQAKKATLLQDKEKLAKNLSEIQSFAEIKVKFHDYFDDYYRRYPYAQPMYCIIL